MTVRAYLRDFSGHLFVRNSQVSLLVVFPWPHVEPERGTERSLIMQMHAKSYYIQKYCMLGLLVDESACTGVI